MAISGVLDASAILAVMLGERGAEQLTDEIVEGARVSAVNLAEVHSKLVRDGRDAEEAWMDIQMIVPAAEPFTMQQAKAAGELIVRTRDRGLSLGDRCCLALAIELGVPIYTTEQVWRGLEVGVPIHVIR